MRSLTYYAIENAGFNRLSLSLSLVFTPANRLFWPQKFSDTLNDNGPILEYLLNQEEFPAKGYRFAGGKKKFIISSGRNKLITLLPELTNNFRKFYIKAQVAAFLKHNSSFYEGALKEISNDKPVRLYSYRKLVWQEISTVC